MAERPEYLTQGEDARLIPVSKDSNIEGRLLSPVLAAMTIVPEFARTILQPMGIFVGKTTKIRALTEVSFVDHEQQKFRQDGLLILTTGKKTHRVLIEAKARSNNLDLQQIEDYLQLARANKIDALITISNQFTANATHSPLKVRKALLNKVNLFHLSWSMVRTSVDLMLGAENIEDDDRILIMRELQRFLTHPSTGISGLTQMNKGWRNIVKAFSSGAAPAKSDANLLETVTAWHQEQKDMCLRLSRHLQTPVALKLPKKHKMSASDWHKNTVQHLLDTNCLRCEIDVPDAAAAISIEANLARKTVSTSIRLSAPKDRVSNRARCNWLLNQIKTANDPRIVIRLHFPGNKPVNQFDLETLRKRPELSDDGTKVQANYLEVRLHEGLAGDFSGTKKFIERLEGHLFSFYDQVVTNVKNWQPSAPRPIIRDQSEPEEAPQAAPATSPGDLN